MAKSNPNEPRPNSDKGKPNPADAGGAPVGKNADSKGTSQPKASPKGKSQPTPANSASNETQKGPAKSDQAKSDQNKPIQAEPASSPQATGAKASGKQGTNQSAGNKPSRSKPATAAAAQGLPAAQPHPAAQQSASQQRATQQRAAAPNQQSPQNAAPAAHHREAGSARFLLFNLLPSWFVSMIVHAALIIMLALFTIPQIEKKRVEIDSDRAEEVVLLEEFEVDEIEMVEDQVLDSFETPDSSDLPQQLTDAQEEPEVADTIEMPMTSIDLSSFADQHAPISDLSQRNGSGISGDLSSRSSNQRNRMVKDGGGSDASERAVAMALQWLAAHQREDGGWDFDHTRGPGSHRTSPNEGNAIRARNGATAIALLPFLGAGQTHLEGKYKETVERGLKFLIRNQRPEAGAGTFFEPQGNMYSHGLCTIALTEAYAMTNDRDLIIPAQAAINYIVYAQDPVGGGWRYSPKQAGDTSVVGWQLMALKSGYMGYLEIPPATTRNAENFLESVSMENGAFYGYTTPNQGKATTAIGLLCRMYMGWEKDNPSLIKGVEYLSEQGPSKDGNVDMYYNYYATQVMRHFGGDEWEKWNSSMRDWLVEKQETEGNLAGSWHFNHPWAERGGRLYNTALSCMVLEVYYRHMPIYRDKAAVEEFPLD